MNEKHICKSCGETGRITCPRRGGYGFMDDKEKITCYHCQGHKEVEYPACNGTGMVED